jgi:peptidoglycan/xylan/chitin deacetylase (PgdA/CDA1 family)
VVTEVPAQTAKVQVAAGPAQPPKAQAAAAPAPQTAPAAQSASASPMPKVPPIQCSNPNALGVSRVVEIDTTGGPGFGFEHFKSHDFLLDHEVVLTFDDGPWLNNTPMVLKALADQCVRATFFPIGKHSTYYPEILRQVAAAGHTIGSHTWSHLDLEKLSKKSVDDAKTEVELGISAVHAAVGAQLAPFFRFPALRHPPEIVTYLGERKSVMDKLAKHGKGIILMHDFQQATAHAVPELLARLKAGGFKVVHLTARDSLQSLPQYDEMLKKDQKLPTVDQRPTSSVVRTISE